MTRAQELLPTIGQKNWNRSKEYHDRTGIPRQIFPHTNNRTLVK